MATPPPSGPPRLLSRSTPPLKRIVDLAKERRTFDEWYDTNLRFAIDDLAKNVRD
jgi:hypothetical protein